MQNISVKWLEDEDELVSLQDAWTALWSQSDNSFSSSWTWVATWWSTYRSMLGNDTKLLLGIALSEELSDPEPLLVGIVPLYQRGGGVKKQIFALGVGEPKACSVASEFVDVLALPGYATPFHAALREDSLLQRCDQITFGWVREGSVLEQLQQDLQSHSYYTTYHPTELRGFEAVTNTLFEGYLNSLPQRKRSVVRRVANSLTHHHFCFDEALSLEERLAWLNALIEQHQKHWVTKHHAGAFSTNTVIEFHTKVLALSSAPRVFRLWNQAGIAGYLYGFQCPRRFEWYQAAWFEHPDLKSPGLALQVAAIDHFCKEGSGDRYDMLVGENQLKRSLASKTYIAPYVQLTRPTVPRALLANARTFKKKLTPLLRRLEIPRN
jgi:hypothetical protein